MYNQITRLPSLDFQLYKYLLDFGFRSSIDRVQLEQIGIGQLHWSTANYAPPQERALWDGLVAMYDKVTMNLFYISGYKNLYFILQ